MEKSGLQCKNPRLVDVEFKINRDFDNQDDESINIKTEFHVNIDKIEEKSEAIVELTVIIGSKDHSQPFYISATEGALFRWSEDLNERESILLEQNAPAILLGYIRSIVSMLTAVSPFEAYDIPLINFKK